MNEPLSLFTVLQKCFNELEKLKVLTPPGRFVPECNADGWYRQIQCHRKFGIFTNTINASHLDNLKAAQMVGI